MSNFISNINSNNKNLCIKLWGSERNCIFDSKKKTKMLFHWHVLTRTIEPAAYVKLYHINFDAFEIAMHITKLNCVIKCNYEEVCTHVSCGTASMWDCFEHWGMKLFLISDKLWCNSASFASKDIVFRMSFNPLPRGIH